jgi:hypothetical protein
MRHLNATRKGSWRMYITYMYEVVKAIAITLLIEFDIKGVFLVCRGIIDGVYNRGGKA